MSSGADPFDLASIITAHDDGNFADAVVPPIFPTFSPFPIMTR